MRAATTSRAWPPEAPDLHRRARRPRHHQHRLLTEPGAGLGCTQSGEWTVAQVKAQFKKASRKQKAIQDCLDSLTELGVIAVHTEDGPPLVYR